MIFGFFLLSGKSHSVLRRPFAGFHVNEIPGSLCVQKSQTQQRQRQALLCTMGSWLQVLSKFSLSHIGLVNYLGCMWWNRGVRSVFRAVREMSATPSQLTVTTCCPSHQQCRPAHFAEIRKAVYAVTWGCSSFSAGLSLPLVK